MQVDSKWLCTLAALAVAASAPQAHAQEASPAPTASEPSEPTVATPAPPSRSVALLVRMDLAFGGKELARVQWSDGTEGKLKAGQLMTFAAGVLFHPELPVAVEGTVGYKFDQVNGSNGSIKFTRLPVDVVVSYAYRGHRLGAGLTAHLSPKFSCAVDGLCDTSTQYRTAFGPLAQYAYGFRIGNNGGFELGARYTRVKYSGSGLETIDGSGFGLLAGAWF
jgi:hypothetical protein